jgi:hypothetical protein
MTFYQLTLCFCHIPFPSVLLAPLMNVYVCACAHPPTHTNNTKKKKKDEIMWYYLSDTKGMIYGTHILTCGKPPTWQFCFGRPGSPFVLTSSGPAGGLGAITLATLLAPNWHLVHATKATGQWDNSNLTKGQRILQSLTAATTPSACTSQSHNRCYTSCSGTQLCPTSTHSLTHSKPTHPLTHSLSLSNYSSGLFHCLLNDEDCMLRSE